MTKIFVRMETGYCGEEAAEVIDVDYPASELVDRCCTQAIAVDEIVHEMAINNAQMYGHDEVDEDSEFNEDPYENVYGYWEVYNKEEHDQYLILSDTSGDDGVNE